MHAYRVVVVGPTKVVFFLPPYPHRRREKPEATPEGACCVIERAIYSGARKYMVQWEDRRGGEPE